MTIVGGICPRCGQFHDLFLAVDGSIVCRNADGTAERIRQLEAERDAARAQSTAAQAEARVAESEVRVLAADLAAARAEVERLRSPEWEAEVRADERAVAQVQACDAHISQVRWAEAVAARLVEVIRVDDLRLRTQKGHTAQARRERNAARAEVAALQVFAQDANEAFASGRREVLADLRAKVGLIPAHAVRMEHKWVNGQGWVPTTETIYTVPLAAVLALFEEVDRG